LRARKVGMLVGLEVFAGSHCVGDVEASFVLGRVFKAPGKPPRKCFSRDLGHAGNRK
jgi:hypothetical protein